MSIISSRPVLWLQDVFTNNAIFFIAFFLVNVLTTAIYLCNQGDGDIAISYVAAVYAGSVIVTLLLHLLPWRWLRLVLKTIILIPLMIIFITESFTLYIYDALLGTGIINSIMETNVHESIEFLENYIGITEIGLIILFFGVIILGYKMHIWRYITRYAYIWSKIAVLLLPLSICYTIYGLCMYTNFYWDNPAPVQRVYSSVEVAYRNMRAYEELSKNINSNVVLTENKSDIPYVIFILGEATNRNHMHLYGYYLPTTPNLDKLQANGEIAVFTDIISPHSTTIAVLSKLFTFAHHESDKQWYQYNNLIDIMNKAGYKTFWLSNQESSGIWGNVAQIYAAHSSKSQFTRIRDSREDFGIEDEALFPLLDNSLQETGAKNFMVLHLMGGHVQYYNRFPYSFSKFKASDIKLNLPEDKRTIVAQYDNAIYYNDYVVTQMINRFRDKDAIVIYLPDHGEAVYDEGDNINGHLEENITYNMIEIPLIMWASPEFKQKHAATWAKITKAVHRPYMTDDMIHTVMDIVGVKTADYDPTRSIINPHFNSKRLRISKDMNYDTQIKIK